jgi:CBS domain-containing protein
MLVAGIMKKIVITISPLATVREALMMMKERGVKSLVVEKRHSGDAYGLIAYRDVAKAVIAEDGDIDLLNVYDIAQKPALQVSQHLEIRYLARLMIQYSVKSVLVIDNNELQGFVSDTDVVSQPDRPCRQRPLAREHDGKDHSPLLGLFPRWCQAFGDHVPDPGGEARAVEWLVGADCVGVIVLPEIRHRLMHELLGPRSKPELEFRQRSVRLNRRDYDEVRCSGIPAMRRCANCCSAAKRRTCSSPTI